tara:strand:- start:437 stop:1009 length:573 start_codon:yes stop_codon:yes gene_type:complete
MSKLTYATQNDLLLTNLLEWYNKDNNLNKMLEIINGESSISLRIVDWFATNYAKKNFTVYSIQKNNSMQRFKVYIDYKLKLKAYSKKRFDPFCRWERISIPYTEGKSIQTTIGQLNFFKWALENKVIDYIEQNYADIEKDMNKRNSTSRKKITPINLNKNNLTRKKREELSVSAAKSIKKEQVEIIVKFN